MRVISGIFRGKRLFAPVGNAVRPTTDRIKESLFNILSSRGGFDGTRVLDLFCGSGALGIESLSRGAEHVVFVDKSVDSVRLTKKNLEFVGAKDFEIYNTDYAVALRKLAGKKFDFIFLDPPYDFKAVDELFDNIEKSDILGENGTIIFEIDAKNNLHLSSQAFIIEARHMGNTSLMLITKAK